MVQVSRGLRLFNLVHWLPRNVATVGWRRSPIPLEVSGTGDEVLGGVNPLTLRGSHTFSALFQPVFLKLSLQGPPRHQTLRPRGSPNATGSAPPSSAPRPSHPRRRSFRPPIGSASLEVLSDTRDTWATRSSAREASPPPGPETDPKALRERRGPCPVAAVGGSSGGRGPAGVPGETRAVASRARGSVPTAARRGTGPAPGTARSSRPAGRTNVSFPSRRSRALPCPLSAVGPPRRAPLAGRPDRGSLTGWSLTGLPREAGVRGGREGRGGSAGGRRLTRCFKETRGTRRAEWTLGPVLARLGVLRPHVAAAPGAVPPRGGSRRRASDVRRPRPPAPTPASRPRLPAPGVGVRGARRGRVPRARPGAGRRW